MVALQWPFMMKVTTKEWLSMRRPKCAVGVWPFRWWEGINGDEGPTLYVVYVGTKEYAYISNLPVDGEWMPRIRILENLIIYLFLYFLSMYTATAEIKCPSGVVKEIPVSRKVSTQAIVIH